MQYRFYYKRKLPHYQPKHGVFFITLRLSFDLPEKFLLTLNLYRESLKNEYAKSENEALAREVIKKKSFDFEDELYNKCASEVDLSREPAAGIIMEKLLAMQGDLIYLYASTIMSNHVHMLIQPLERDRAQIALSSIIKDFKGSTARKINLVLDRQGQLWYREYYDHWIRSQQELINVIEYIRNNPVRAGLVKDARQWQWTWLNSDLWHEE